MNYEHVMRQRAQRRERIFAKDYILLVLVHRTDCMGRPESLILLNYMYRIAWRIGLYVERIA